MMLVEISDHWQLSYFPTLESRRASADSAQGPNAPAVRIFEARDRLDVAGGIGGAWCESFYLLKDAAATIQRSAVLATMWKYFRAASANNMRGCERCLGYLEAHAYLRRKCLRPNVSLTIADLLQAHRRLFVRQKLGRRMAGYLRTDAVPAADVTAYGAQYQALPADKVSAALEKLMAFIGSSRGLDPVDHAAIVHGEIVLLRPFQVGNMRLAQILTSVLLEKRARVLPILNLNSILRHRLIEYQKRLKAVASRNDWQNWIQFFESCVTEGAEASSQGIFEVTRMLAERQDRLVSDVNTRMPALRLDALLRFGPVITVSHAAKLLKVSVPTAKIAIDTLVRCVILEEITGRQRDQEFADMGFLRILAAESL